MSQAAMTISGVQRSAETLRARLAAETCAIHKALHSHPRLLPLGDGSISRQQLLALLGDYLIIYDALEQRRKQSRWCAQITLSAPIQRLRADHEALRRLPRGRSRRGQSPGGQSPALTRPFEDLPREEAHCLGALYVLLGAQFGGKLLGRTLARTMPEFRSSFFAPCSATLAQWRDLLALLEDAPARGYDEVKVVTGAQHMFESFGQFLDRAVPAGVPSANR